MKFLFFFFFLLNLYELHAWYWLEGNCFLYFILFSILTAGLFLVIGFGVECYLHLLFLSIHQILKSALTTPIYTQITNPFLSFKHLLSLPSLASQFFHVTLWPRHNPLSVQLSSLSVLKSNPLPALRTFLLFTELQILIKD